MTEVKPQPYSVAVGAVAFAFTTIFHKNLPVEAVAGLPALATAVVAAFEKGLTLVHTAAADVAGVAKTVETVATKVEAVTADQALAASHTQPFQP